METSKQAKRKRVNKEKGNRQKGNKQASKKETRKQAKRKQTLVNISLIAAGIFTKILGRFSILKFEQTEVKLQFNFG